MSRAFLVVLAILAVALASSDGLSASRQGQAPTAEALLSQAMAAAAPANKAVFVDFGASWCVPCKRLEAMMLSTELKPVFERYFHLLTITVWEHNEKAVLNNSGGEALMAGWRGSGASSIPFYAVLDRNRRAIATGNGYPGSPQEAKEFMSFLSKAAPAMTTEEKQAISRYIEEKSDPFGSVSGRVVNVRGEPVAGATVTMLARVYAAGQWQFARNARAETDEGGRYTLQKVSPGAYRILAETAGSSGLYRDATAASPAMVAVARNQDRVAVDVHVSSSSSDRVAGVVVSAQGQPGSQSSVRLVRADVPQPELTTTAAANGSFSFPAVNAGAYHLWASRSGDPREISLTSFSVPGSNSSKMTVRMNRSVTLSGSVAFDGPTLSATDRARIRIEAVAVNPPAGAPRERLSSPLSATGRFDIPGVWGNRVIRTENLPAGWVLDRVTIAGRDVTDTAIDSASGSDLNDLAITISHGSGELVGTAADADRQLRRGGVVILFAADPTRRVYPSRFVRTAAVDDRGAYAIRSLVPGDYLVVWVPQLEQNWDAPESLERLQAQATAVSVRASR